MNSQGTKNANSDWCYEVTNVQLSGSTYDPASNLMTIGCEGGTGAKSLGLQEISNSEQLEGFEIYPNPTNDKVNITYHVKQNSVVQIRVVTLLGEVISVLVEESKEAGEYQILWGDDNLKSGTYLVEIITSTGSKTKRLIIINE